MLTGSLSTNNATQVFSTTGHNMFVRFGIGSTFSKPGFSAKINFGNDIPIISIEITVICKYSSIKNNFKKF